MARGLLERLFSSQTKTHSHSRHYLCDAVCECVHVPSSLFLILCFLSFSLSFHTNTHTHRLSFLLEDANIAHDKAPVDSSQTKHFLFKAVHLYAEPIQRPAKAWSPEKQDFHHRSVIPDIYSVSLH